MTIRTGVKEDLPQVLQLIKELAAYEKEPDAVDTTVEQLEQDGFGPDSVFSFLVADTGDKVVGMALYYWSYSTWKGKCMYLEDLVVTKAYRQQGVGRQLFGQLIRIARENDAHRLSWQVLDWNESAIKFYETLNARFDADWINCKLTREQICEVDG